MRRAFSALFLFLAFGLAPAACGDEETASQLATTATSTTVTTTSAVTSTGSVGGEGGGGLGGAGGSGGGLSTGTGGSGGAGGCDDASDCPTPAEPCLVATCDAGACDVGPAPAATPAGDPVDGDCHAEFCDGAGATQSLPVLDDPADDGNECTLDTCQDGAPTGLPQPVKTPCAQGVCDAAGACVQCVDAADCGGQSCNGGVCSACPAGTVDLGTHCIDATEVTVAQYLAFLAVSPGGQPAECAWNQSYVPAGGAPPSSQLPIANVDWCDARAYCAWAGKRLCGKIGGGALPYASYTDPASSQWQAACSGGGVNAFPYGNAFSASACNGQGSGLGTSAPVGSVAGCKGTMAPYDAVRDLSGNVWEWEDACTAASGASDTCRVRGGSFNNPQAFLGCAADYALPRQAAFSSVGFRCCSL